MPKCSTLKNKRSNPSPKHGWDNPDDVAAGKRYCKDIAYAILPGADNEILTVEDGPEATAGISLKTSRSLYSDMPKRG